MSSYLQNIVTENGDSFIPASQRPDGTWRKARRVKEGYVPQEEVPLYESKGKQFMNKRTEPVKLSTGQPAQRCIPGLYIIEDEKKTQPKKKKAAKNVDDLNQQLESIKISEKKEKRVTIKEKNQEITSDPVKRLKNLRKRLREVEALEEKMQSGQLQKPEPEQLAKVKRKGELVQQIEELEKITGQ